MDIKSELERNLKIELIDLIRDKKVKGKLYLFSFALNENSEDIIKNDLNNFFNYEQNKKVFFTINEFIRTECIKNEKIKIKKKIYLFLERFYHV